MPGLFLLATYFLLANIISKICSTKKSRQKGIMYLIAIKFLAAFPDGNKVVEITSPSSGGGGYHIMVDNYYCGSIAYYTTGWQVNLTMKEYQFTAEDLEPLLELVKNQTIG